MAGTAILIGNSDGIGLATTRELVKRGWRVAGVSRSASPVEHPAYTHTVARVQDPGYPSALRSVLEEIDPVDLCLYCAGIGEWLDPAAMDGEAEIIEVNLVGMVKTLSCVVPAMVERGEGHFIGLSSMADEILSAEAPSYHASKAGCSSYLEGLALALRPRGVHVSNVRFGFVDTKMAKGDVKPFMMGVDRAVLHVMACIERKPVRYTAPWSAIPLVWFRRWALRGTTIVHTLRNRIANP